MPEQAILRNRRYNPLEKVADAGIVSSFSLRTDGNMSLCYGDTKDSMSSRKNFLSALGIDYRDLICAKQSHESNIIYVREADKGRGALSYESSITDTDGLITDRKNLPLAIFSADCPSIFLYDYKTKAIGLIHAGWRSTREHIAGKAVKLMQREFNTNPEGLYAGFGPAIRKCCYEVSSDFSAPSDSGMVKRDNRYYFDLIGANKKELLDSGIKEDNIFDPEICTSCLRQEFFSLRREGKPCGRLISVMMLK
ncbi:MAG: peptidoglycan editing factor PgeF [Candidatus Omnitrophota bacterium]